MPLGFVGLGRMGSNMVTRLLQGGHSVVAWDVNADAVRAVAGPGARGAAPLAELAGALAPPRGPGARPRSRSSRGRSLRRARCGSWCPPASRPRRQSES
ncbi:MAG: hypothetical protein DMD76_30050 [Candidatus Rokuibacteriota bacterium]|nr:MAG: hypothetical protein DMD76_30050 [Candidatus Rokubacteria bacterium]